MSSTRSLFVALALAAAGAAIAAEPAGLGDAEKPLAAKLDCAKFTKNPD
jgi:hypothetical protein